MEKNKLVSKKNKVVPLEKREEQKGQGIYVRLPVSLLAQIDQVESKHGFKDRSKTIRAILESAFSNGIC